MNDEPLKYPVGRFSPQDTYTREELQQCIHRIAALPARITEVIAGFSDHHYETPYRPGGWTARQVIHHLPDSHMNAYTRFKLALTEDTPTIRPYDEKRWAETPDTRLDPAVSLNLLSALHVKWVSLLQTLNDADLSREYLHPETGRRYRLDHVIALYAWHGEHHLGHLKIVAEKAQ